METEHNNGPTAISKHSTPLSRWIAEQLTILAEAFGESLTSQRLKIYVADIGDIPAERLNVAFQRARRELRFFPKVAEILDLADVGHRQPEDAEARAAWDEVMKFVPKYVSNDVYGNYGPEHGWHPRTYPKLCDRILDTVRRTGDWSVYSRMTDEDFPFVQKRFLQEYAAWTAVERVDASKLLTELPRLQLVSDRWIQPRETQPGSIAPPPFKPKLVPAAMTDAQLRDRRELLRKQAEAFKSRSERSNAAAD